MGEIRANVTLENTADRNVFDRGHGLESDIRRTTVDGLVDTGAVSLVLPQDIVERLGLDQQGTAVVMLDLIADCENHTLAPQHPDYPVLKTKAVRTRVR